MIIKIKKFNHNNKRKNFGIEILRMILCFWVIVFHYSGNKIKNKYKIINQFFHVPTFFFISFYLNFKIFFSKNIYKIKQRLERLIIPYIIIPIIYLIIKYFLTGQNTRKIFYHLFLQYITGHYFYFHFWFIHNLIIYSILFEIIFLFFKKKGLFILQLLSIILYWLKCKEIFNRIFENYKYHIRMFTMIGTMIPISVTGITFGFMDILKMLMKNRIKNIFFFIVIFYFICNFNEFGEIKYNLGSISLFFSFSLIPLEKVKNNKIISIIKIITKFTGGIYYYQSIIYNLYV